MTKVTAIIPSLAEVDKHYLKLCVESLRATVDWDIIVVTNGGRDQNPIADLKIKGISKHLHTKQQGQCNAVNIGAQVAESNTDYLFVSNADMYYAPGWNKNLRFDDLCFSPNLVEPTNNAGSAPPFLKYNGGFTLDEFQREAVDDMIEARVDIEKGVEETGFNLPFFIRKDIWQTIGGYDTKYDPWGSNSDTDLQTKINLAGITPMRLRDVLVYHFSNKSGTFDNSNQEYWWRNWNYYQDKWGFNRDELGSDVWMNKDMLPTDKARIKYQPEWAGKYEA